MPKGICGLRPARYSPLKSRMGEIRIKRIYEPAEEADGYRVLIDRIWPRGISKQRASLDEWAKDLAPSAELRKWFSHEPSRFEEFRKRYRDELSAQNDRVRELRIRASSEPVTILYGAHDETHNNAVVLREVVRGSR